MVFALQTVIGLAQVTRERQAEVSTPKAARSLGLERTWAVMTCRSLPFPSTKRIMRMRSSHEGPDGR